MSEAEARRIASVIDHAVLHPRATAEDVARDARRCARLGVRGICVVPRRVAQAVLAATSGTRVVAVIGFPAGAGGPASAACEASTSAASGANELDVVLPLGVVREGRWDRLRDEVSGVRATAPGVELKLIVEASDLDDATVEAVLREVVAPSGARWLKTGTGVYGEPLPIERVRAIASMLPEGVGLKVAGGIRSRERLDRVVEAGADVVGTSATFDILDESGSGDRRPRRNDD